MLSGYNAPIRSRLGRAQSASRVLIFFSAALFFTLSDPRRTIHQRTAVLLCGGSRKHFNPLLVEDENSETVFFT